MPWTAIELCKRVLPMTNCGDCGVPTCLAFASAVVQEKRPLGDCPHLSVEQVGPIQAELEQQHEQGTWLKRDIRKDALVWAKKRAASLALSDLEKNLGGTLVEESGLSVLRLPYFEGHVVVQADDIVGQDGLVLDHWEKVFLYNHLAQGGTSRVSGRWLGFEQIPNTISKIISMQEHVEQPLVKRFGHDLPALRARAPVIGGREPEMPGVSADAAFLFLPLPRVPVMLLFWAADEQEGFEAKAKLVFDETVTDHLDIESIIFLSESLCKRLCAAATD